MMRRVSNMEADEVDESLRIQSVREISRELLEECRKPSTFETVPKPAGNFLADD